MNDRFKFRVWDKKEKCWIDNVVAGLDGELWSVIDVELPSDGNWTELYHLDDKDRYTRVDCTGLIDKNCKLIYEGDICECISEYQEDGAQVYAVKWGGDECNYPAFTMDGYEDWEYNSLQYFHEVGQIKVIGNIHENKDLLGD